MKSKENEHQEFDLEDQSDKDEEWFKDRVLHMLASSESESLLIRQRVARVAKRLGIESDLAEWKNIDDLPF